jgi:hypothetical protein
VEQKDYLQKQIDLIGRLLGKMIAEALSLKTKGNLNADIEVTHKILKEELKLDVDPLISADVLIRELTQHSGFDTNNLSKLADWFELLGDHSDVELRKQYQQNALAIWEYIDGLSQTYDVQRQQKMSRLRG